jgi:hypothetical protein
MMKDGIPMKLDELTALITEKFEGYDMDRDECGEEVVMIRGVAAWLHLEDEGDRYLKWDLQKMVRDCGSLSSVLYAVGQALRDLAEKAPDPDC